MIFPLRIESILLRCVKFIIYLIPVLPLFIAPSVMFPYITGKNFAFRILVELAAAFWLGLIAANKEYRLRNSAMVLSVLAFTFVVGLADLIGVNPYNSFWSNYERMEGYITILHLSLFFLIAKSIFRSKKDWIIFFSMYLVVSVFVSLFTIIEPLLVKQAANYIKEYGTRMAGTIGNPPFLAAYLLFSVFLGLLLMHMTQKKYFKLLCIFSVIINAIVIYLTASRGAIIAAVAGAVIMSMSLIFNKLKNPAEINFKKAVPLILGLLILLSAALLAYNYIELLKNDRTVSRFMLIFSDDPSVRTRIDAWKMAWNGIKENPLLGWGQENFIGVYTVNPIYLGDKLIWLDRAHNIILDWLVNAGILGLCSYLAIYGTAFYILLHNFRRKIISKNEAVIITTAIIVYFIQNLFSFDSISSYLIFFALMAYIDNIESMKITPDLNSNDNVNLKKTGMKSLLVTISALIIFAITSYYINYIPIKKIRLYSNISMSLSKYESFPTLLMDLNKALSYRAFGDTYIRDVMQGVSQQIIKDQLYEQEGALRFVQKTVEEIEKELSANKLNLEYIMKTFWFYKLLGRYDTSFIKVAEILLKRCMLINPQYQRLELDMIDIYFLKKDYVSAVNNIKRILKFHPDMDALHFKLAVASILTSKELETENALENYKNLRIANNDVVASGIEPVFYIKQLYTVGQAYLEIKNYKYAMKYYDEILYNLVNYRNIQLGPGSAQFLTDEEKMNIKAKLHLEIAKVHIAMGDEENARKEAEKAIEIAPLKFAEEAKKIIDQLINKDKVL